MKNGPEVIVSCDIGLGEGFNFVDLDAEEVSRFLSGFDIPSSENPLSVVVRSRRDISSTKRRRIFGKFDSRTDSIEIYPEEIQEWQDGKIEPVAEGTLLHELGHYVDAKVNPEVFQKDLQDRSSLLKREANGLDKIHKRTKFLLGFGFLFSVTDIFVDKPVELDTMLTFSSLGFIAMTIANFVHYNAVEEQFGKTVIQSYSRSRNEQFANQFAVDHYFSEAGKLLRLEKRL